MIAATLTFGSVTPVLAAESAKPEDPNGYGERVRFGAKEDHDIYPGPGNVVGGFRHDAARNSEGPGVSAEVQEFREGTGSTPNPPGQG
jgi:hypothetical protein